MKFEVDLVARTSLSRGERVDILSRKRESVSGLLWVVCGMVGVKVRLCKKSDIIDSKSIEDD